MVQKEKKETEEENIIKEAKEEAARIIKEAEDTARQIYGSSLEYVDDMLSEVNLIVLRSKELMRLQMESMLEEFDGKIDLLAGHKQELLEILREHTEEGKRPIKKGSYEIKIDESYLPKKTGYEIKIQNGTETKVEVHKPAKADYEIKIADEWKERIESMLAAANEPMFDELEPKAVPEITVKEEGKGQAPDEDGEEIFHAEDFNLDDEYFQWLEEK